MTCVLNMISAGALVFMMGANPMAAGLEARIEIVTPPSRIMEKTPIFAMGEHIKFKASFRNVGKTGAHLDDPLHSQQLLLRIMSTRFNEPLTFLINPGFVDATGEATAPPVRIIDILPSQEIAREIDLNEHCPDKCFMPGTYTLTLEYEGVKSAIAPFGIEFRDTSVPLLINIVVDEAADRSLRLEAKRWLDRLPRPPRVIVNSAADSRRNAAEFLTTWDQEKSSKDTRATFDAMRLK